VAWNARRLLFAWLLRRDVTGGGCSPGSLVVTGGGLPSRGSFVVTGGGLPSRGSFVV